MGSTALAQARATPVPPTKAHLQSLCSWRSENRSQATEIVNEVSVCPTLSCSEGDPGQPGQENRRNRWSKIPPTCRSTCSGRSHSPQPHDREETKAAQARLGIFADLDAPMVDSIINPMRRNVKGFGDLGERECACHAARMGLMAH